MQRRTSFFLTSILVVSLCIPGVCGSLGLPQSETIDSSRFVFRSDQDQALVRWAWDTWVGPDPVTLRFYCKDEFFDDLPFEGVGKTTYIVCDTINVRVVWPKGPNTECLWEFGTIPGVDDAPEFTVVDD